MNPSEDPARQPSGQAVIVDADGLPALFEALRGRGYTVVGPTVRDGAIVVAELASAAELPFGWGVETEAGRYRLRERSDTAAFGHSAGPQSWKTVLHPPRAKLWSADRVSGTVEVGETAEPPRYALLGVRPCDVRAIGILDQVLTGGRHAGPCLPRAARWRVRHRGRVHGAGGDLFLHVDGWRSRCRVRVRPGDDGADRRRGPPFRGAGRHGGRRRRAGRRAEPGRGRGDGPARRHGGSRGGRPYGPRHADAGPAAAAGGQPRVPALGRRRHPAA